MRGIQRYEINMVIGGKMRSDRRAGSTLVQERPGPVIRSGTGL